MLSKFKAFTGPRTFKFKDPDSSFLYESDSLQGLLSSIKSYRLQNELPPIDYLEMVVESYLCNLPEHKGDCYIIPTKTLKRGFLQYIRGGVALLKNLAYKSTVRPEVANARSLICKGCPLNTFPDRGPFITWSDNIALASVGSLRSTYHDFLGTCSGCGCPLRAKVFYNGNPHLTEEESKTMRAANPNCWQVNYGN